MWGKSEELLVAYILNRVPKFILLNKLQKFNWASFSTVNSTSATPYNCDATITFFLTAQQWTSDATTINISFSAINCAQPPIQLTSLDEIWMQHGDLKTFIMMHQHTEARNHFLSKTRNPVTCFAEHQGSAEPLLKNTELDYISPHKRKSILTSANPTTIFLDLHKRFLDPTKRFYSQVKKTLKHLQNLWAHHSHMFAHSHPPYS